MTDDADLPPLVRRLVALAFVAGMLSISVCAVGITLAFVLRFGG